MPPPTDDPSIEEVSTWRFRGGKGREERDLVVAEAPLEIRYGGRAVATVMRTPGSDADLAVGHLYAEGWIDGPDDIAAVTHCARLRPEEGAAPADAYDPRNIVEVRPVPGRPEPAAAARPRTSTATASCGVCGKETIADALRLGAPVSRRAAGESPARVPWVRAEVLAGLPGRLREHQRVFAATGGLHAAGLFRSDGAPIVVREDIGRHNAVDAVVGHALRADALPLEDAILQVSGRVSFEIVQKAYRAGIPVIGAVSGVSSLAVRLAIETDGTLAGFVRGGEFAVYAGAWRLVRAPAARSAPSE